ncbi:MAG: hypothetical protein HC803_07365 [Saprospiraceae bacterium]|nr:hypothetical protein [Saprospiraceae bacterium]
MDIIMIQNNLIDIIRQTTNLKKLAAISEAVYDISVTEEEAIENTETVIEKPRKEIPVAEIKKA